MIVSLGTRQATADGDHMIEFMRKVLTTIGPRRHCRAGERALGDRLVNRWKRFGVEVDRHRFRCSPDAFLGSIRLSAVLYLGAVSVLFWSPGVAAAGFATAALVLWLEVLRYHELVDRLFPKEHGENIVGRVPPQGEVRRRYRLPGRLAATRTRLRTPRKEPALRRHGRRTRSGHGKEARADSRHRSRHLRPQDGAGR